MRPSFETVDEGLAVVDPIERHRYVLSTPTVVAPQPIERENFRFPVDAAASIRTTEVSLPSVISVHVRDGEGTPLCTAEHFAHEELPYGRYSIELSAPIKCYLRVESSVIVSADAERMRLDFDDSTEVLVGARSHHDHPAATVTTTTDPKDLMRAISTFGSALKTTTPERSYPTLRGHPPAVELGEELDLAGLEPPDTGISIEVPPEYGAIFVVSPLAYYLGARVVPGDEPRLRTDEGFEYNLNGPEGFERTVENTLKGTFFLDCLARTEGLYPVDLHERRTLESSLGLDFAALYDRSLAEQLEAYLDVPFETIEEHIPEWKLTTHVEPVPGSVEMLPFVVDDLAVVRCGTPEEVPNPTQMVAFDGGTGATTETRSEGGFTWSASAPVETDGAFVELEPAESLEQAWVGAGIPLGASKAILEAYENRLDRTPSDGDIDITVVCNDAEMDEERGLIDEIYGDREELPFDVTVERDLTTAELEAVLSTQTDFLHYVGHVDPEGFECVDGKLDAGSLKSVGVDAFLLNACQSYRQGVSLIKRGSIGGIVTLSDVLNSEAVKMGQTLARLLNAGFPLWSALKIARGESIMGDHYLVIGDGGLAIAQAKNWTPILLEIEDSSEGFVLRIKTYPTTENGMGSLIIPHLKNIHQYYLSSGVIQEFTLSKDELQEYLSLGNAPLRIGGNLRWDGRVD